VRHQSWTARGFMNYVGADSGNNNK